MIRLLISLLLITSCQVLVAERYITLAPHLTEILYDLNVGDQIVGTVEHSDYPAQAKQIAVIGNFQQLNIESIIALTPKIIFAWPDGNPEMQLDRLEQLGIRIFKSAPADLSELAL